MKIIALFPLTGNGGIASWAKKLLDSFPSHDYLMFPVDNAPKDRNGSESFFVRTFSGFAVLGKMLNDIKRQIVTKKVDILHASTSGSIGSYRDIKVAKLCKKYGVKTILHCHYGCITENVESKGIIGLLTRKAMSFYDQIWVLDSRSYNTLKKYPSFASKVRLVPNPIDVVSDVDKLPKQYKRVAFIGNLIPTKGIYELVEACTKTDVQLDIIGPGTDEVVNRIKELSGSKLNKSIFLHGRLPNSEAIEFMKNIDILALPTYYPSEAFPISIIEAMSLTKMVISCPRAAVADMLTSIDGNPCGKLVEPKSVKSIVDAINWCQSHKQEADLMCQKAFEKVNSCYRKEVVYKLYRQYYNEL